MSFHWPHPLAEVAVAIILVNLPFGYWRAGVRKFSLAWFLAVHLPVGVAIALRLLSGLGWRLSTMPILVGAFFLGQFLGGRFRRWSNAGRGTSP